MVIIYGGIFVLLIVYSFVTFMRYLRFKALCRLVEGEGSVGIFGMTGYGKGVLGVAMVRYLQSKKSNRKNVSRLFSSPSVIKKDGLMSYKLKLDTFNFNSEKTFFPYTERDIIYLQEIHLVLNGREYKDLDKKYSSFGVFRSLIRQMFLGTIIYDSQHPNSVWIQIREQTGWYIQIKEPMRKGFFFNKFVIDIYSELEDYNKDLSQLKDPTKNISLIGKAKHLVISIPKRQSFGKYDSRAYKIVGDMKLNKWLVNCCFVKPSTLKSMSFDNKQKLIEKNISRYAQLEMTASDLKYLGYNKISELIETATIVNGGDLNDKKNSK